VRGDAAWALMRAQQGGECNGQGAKGQRQGMRGGGAKLQGAQGDGTQRELSELDSIWK